MPEMKERIFTNLGHDYEHIHMLKYFDALNGEFYRVLFEYFLSDDEQFSDDRIQKELYDTLTKPYVFRLYNNKSMSISGICDYSNNTIEFKFKIENSHITYIKVGVENDVYERKLIQKTG